MPTRKDPSLRSLAPLASTTLLSWFDDPTVDEFHTWTNNKLSPAPPFLPNLLLIASQPKALPKHAGLSCLAPHLQAHLPQPTTLPRPHDQQPAPTKRLLLVSAIDALL
ncbi:hypothetical protein PtA15_2A723 [Puccinia triticina]|uniref:Uncharacterized protein n=1 Tax=Puccinia triticina TaxID=208348 RepID=A0ABY7CE32_9BASI|nr:uncharacterized protein PtA15_2A723 [Puccinia triticina]WAQ82406.1 hypothetical protein PtA15_2A723 [Puccinia triticina]